jgi:AcrR family transcriptional regulator
MASTATRDRILEAAQDVVLSDGVARLTLEKAAARAGVSKGGVLYHFPTRAALVSAMVERLAVTFDAALAAQPERAAAGPDRRPGAHARAYVEESFRPTAGAGDEQGEQIGAAVLAAMASEPELLRPLREAFGRWQAEITADAPDAVRATVARLAADGLWLTELFGLGPLDPTLREQVHAELLRLVG